MSPTLRLILAASLCAALLPTSAYAQDESTSAAAEPATDAPRFWLRAEPVDAALQARLQTLGPTLPGGGFIACTP